MTQLLFLGAMGLFAVASLVEGFRFMVVAAGGVMLAVACVGWIAGMVFRSHIDWGRKAALASLIPVLVIAAGTTAFLWMTFAPSTGADVPPIHALAVVTLAAAFIMSVVNSLKSRQRRGAIALRKTLAAGRAYFAAELDRAPGTLREEWYPWVLAYGLDRQAAEWSSRRAATDGSVHHTPNHESTRHGPASESWTGFGGGRSGGAGASGSWAAAAGGMAAGCARRPADSDGGSSSSSDSGSSSSRGRQAEAAAGDGDAIAVRRRAPP